MATKKTTATEDKLEKQEFDLFTALDALDRKDYGWYSRLTDEQQKKFVPYMMLHWASAVKADGAVGGYFVMSSDANANKHFFNENVQKHPELQWLMLCTISPGIGKQFHQWIPHLNAKIAECKTQAKTKEVQEYFEKLYKSAPKEVVKDAAKQYTDMQNHKFRIAKLYPGMKLQDIEMLATLVTEEELNERDRDSGQY